MNYGVSRTRGRITREGWQDGSLVVTMIYWQGAGLGPHLGTLLYLLHCTLYVGMDCTELYCTTYTLQRIMYIGGGLY